MKRIIVALTLALALLVAARPARAYNISCDGFIAAASSTDPFTQGVAGGFLVGDIDFLAGLLCFVGSPQCNCVQNVFQGQTQALASAVASEVVRCQSVDGNQPAFGSVSRAVRSLCPF